MKNLQSLQKSETIIESDIHETDKQELTQVHTNYFFFRMLSLIDLCLVFLREEENEKIDIF